MCWSPASRIALDGFLRSRGQGVHQFAAAQGLHNDDVHSLGGSGFKAFDAGLGQLVHIVVLYLAEIPVVVVKDLLELLGVAVERESYVADGPGLFFRGDPFFDAEGLQGFPLGEVGDHMHQVVVYIVGSQPLELFVEVLVDGGSTVHQELGQFCGDENFLPQAVFLQYLSQGDFTAGVYVGRVVVVHACLVSLEDEFLGLLDVDGSSGPRKAHTSEAKCRKRHAVSVFSILHKDGTSVSKDTDYY